MRCKHSNNNERTTESIRINERICNSKQRSLFTTPNAQPFRSLFARYEARRALDDSLVACESSLASANHQINVWY